MNLILLFPSDFISKDQVELRDRRLEHATTILKTKVGDQLTVGMVDGLMGQGLVISIDTKALKLKVILKDKPPVPIAVTLIMPLARPPVFKRMLLTAASLGIKQIHILNFNKVEKSLWRSSALQDEAVREQLVLGLEQAKDTQMPTVHFNQRFRPFVEDELPVLAAKTVNIVAHPGGQECPRGLKKPVSLVIGPEGGMVDFEIEALKKIGFKAVDLGLRIMKVESALPFLVGRLGG